MAGLRELSSIIYHEKQQPGSMLCAQHALNSLLQGSYFTAPDLSDIARSLDRLEERYDDANAGTSSTNMDDTGFFSIQVLEDALNVWGLTLVRWRSETMKPYQDHPHTQLGFILNCQQHWFSLRRFGPASANLDEDAGEGHWFNLDSFLDGPQWVGKLYLGMVLQQAEKDGYSVFAVTQLDPTAHLALARTEADHLASTLPEPISATPVTRISTFNPSASSSSNPPSSQPQPIEGFEDEDMALQAALQASLLGGSSDKLVLPPPQRPPNVVPSYARDPIPTGSGPLASGEYSETTGDLDPVAASLARNKVIMDRMRHEQEMAQRELYEEEVARLGQSGVSSGQSGLRDRTEEERGEAEMLRRAIAESQASARTEGHGNLEGDEEDDEMDVDYQPAAPTRQLTGSNAYANVATHGERVYDDDDAELQAALKASLENVPEGFSIPDIPAPSRIEANSGGADIDEGDSFSEADTSMTSSDHPEPSVRPSVDEIRRMRLARFGA